MSKYEPNQELTREIILNCLEIVIDEIDRALSEAEGKERDDIECAINTVEQLIHSFLTQNYVPPSELPCKFCSEKGILPDNNPYNN